MNKRTCPICKKESSPQSEDAPFCSNRCRIIDLARWSDGSYSIPVQENINPDDEESSTLH